MIWKNDFLQTKSDADFQKIALQIFRHQAKNNKVYAEYLSYLGTKIEKVKTLQQIPFLPIQLFKTKKILSSEKKTEIIFTSSGTTGETTSKHYVSDLNLYEKSFKKSFKFFYGSPADYCILALLPSYLEREGSSLIYMMEHFIKNSNCKKSAFYLNNHDELVNTLNNLLKSDQKILLFGVSFALLDLAEKYKLNLKNTIIMETGGMKGRRKEITREELHSTLCKQLGVSKIHSEFGMTELLSQAYSQGHGLFKTPPSMKILIRDIYDPFCYETTGKSGGINIIDLANIYSCAFIETKDLGRIHPDGSFEVLGRFDDSDVRGCNLLVQ